jgi:hypothetical protein
VTVQQSVLVVQLRSANRCQIVSLCNWETVRNEYSLARRQLGTLIRNYGHVENLGEVFKDAERSTDVAIGLVTLRKPAPDSDAEFNGFFIGPDAIEAEGEGLIPYNFVRDIVNRYVEACRIYDKQIESAVSMNGVLDGFYKSKIAFVCTENGQAKARNDSWTEQSKLSTQQSNTSISISSLGLSVVTGFVSLLELLSLLR